jgi:hypothetical protein
MASKSKPAKAPPDMAALIALTKSTQDLLVHFQASLAAASAPKGQANSAAAASSSTELPDALEVIKATVTLLRSHTTTLSLLLLTPPLTPSAVVTKIGDVSSGALSGMVAAATSVPQAGQKDELGTMMRLELRAQVRRLLGTWGDILGLILKLAEKRKGKKGKDEGPTEAERQEVLAATGVVWEACDALLKRCKEGVVGLVVRKAEEYRSTLLDAIEELKEWGEDVDEDDGDKAEGSDGEDGFGDEDEIFGAANKLGKDDKELKLLLDRGVKKLKMVGMLYQALIKRRLKTFQKPSAATTNDATSGADLDTLEKLDKLMAVLKTIPETVDDLASAFYDLDEDEAKETLEKCTGEAKSAVDMAKKSRTGQDDEFTAWSEKWVGALEGV